MNEYLRNGDVSKVLVISNKREAKIFLTPEAESKSIHQRRNSGPSFMKPSQAAADYRVKFGDQQNFENDLKQIIEVLK